MRFLLISLFAISAMATTIELSQKEINLGNLGAGDVIAQNGYFNLERTSATPNIVKLNFEIKVTEMQCTQFETRAYPCGGYYNRGPGYPYPGRPYPGNGYPGRPYPGNGYPYPGPGYGYPVPAMCFQQVCIKYEPMLVNKGQTLKLNFRKAQDLVTGEVENYEVQFSANGNRAAFEAKAPNGYTIKKGMNKLKFIKAGLKD